MPDYLPIDQKAPRVVALQLLKRFRDGRYRKVDRRGRKKPPAVVMAALALRAGHTSSSLLTEVKTVALYMKNEIDAAERLGKKLSVFNPAHPSVDELTDRWPEDRAAQRLWTADLGHLIARLTHLETGDFDPDEARNELSDLFGATAADRAIEEYYTGRKALIRAGRLGVSTAGHISTISGVAGALRGNLIAPARANTNMGGSLSDDSN